MGIWLPAVASRRGAQRAGSEREAVSAPPKLLKRCPCSALGAWGDGEPTADRGERAPRHTGHAPHRPRPPSMEGLGDR